MVKTTQVEDKTVPEFQPVENPMASPAAKNAVEISVRGKKVTVSSTQVNGRTVVVTGKWLKLAVVKDEELVEGGLFKDPHLFISALSASSVRVDIFSFGQNVADTQPRYRFPLEWDNNAVVVTTSFLDWWGKIPQEARKNARRAVKRGVTVRITTFDDELVRGIKAIYDETPIRQGRRFWHFEKDFESIKEENATYPDRSEFMELIFRTN